MGDMGDMDEARGTLRGLPWALYYGSGDVAKLCFNLAHLEEGASPIASFSA